MKIGDQIKNKYTLVGARLRAGVGAGPAWPNRSIKGFLKFKGPRNGLHYAIMRPDGSFKFIREGLFVCDGITTINAQSGKIYRIQDLGHAF